VIEAYSTPNFLFCCFVATQLARKLQREQTKQLRPTQSIIYVPSQVNRFQKIILVIVKYKYLESCSGDFTLQNLILRTRSCDTGFITQSSWVFHFHPSIMVGWKCFVPQLYQLRRGISGGAILKYFDMIHNGGRYWIWFWSALGKFMFERRAKVSTFFGRTLKVMCVLYSNTRCFKWEHMAHTPQMWGLCLF